MCRQSVLAMCANNLSSESAYNRTTSQCMLGELLNAQRGSNNMQPGGRVAMGDRRWVGLLTQQ